ncbi:hypothetical protein Taro_049954 [Colocasia esculenta]|uniref:Uncharacterized protein n=1 Tax=Colocasia esculenta TaxID=4460 RepID=A0A843XC72_COLES|nr:hypothetical protein [Colocasia esculenta]
MYDAKSSTPRREERRVWAKHYCSLRSSNPSISALRLFFCPVERGNFGSCRERERESWVGTRSPVLLLSPSFWDSGGPSSEVKRPARIAVAPVGSRLPLVDNRFCLPGETPIKEDDALCGPHDGRAVMGPPTPEGNPGLGGGEGGDLDVLWRPGTGDVRSGSGLVRQHSSMTGSWPGAGVAGSGQEAERDSEPRPGAGGVLARRRRRRRQCQVDVMQISICVLLVGGGDDGGAGMEPHPELGCSSEKEDSNTRHTILANVSELS